MFHKLKSISKSNLIFYFLLLLMLASRIPAVLKNFAAEGRVIPSASVKNILTEELQVFPPADSPAVVIFWASWCGPCRVEMERLKSSVESGKIPKDKIFALNLFETTDVIKKHLKQNAYPFQFIEVPSFDWQIEMTPTMLLIENGKIISQTTGISLIGIWRAEYLF
jgi:cytochrome c biogenesis protein CcmG, thiol:disulfide interchange protein DsbE